MERRIYETERAQSDILRIWDFIAHSNPTSGDIKAADRVIDSIQETYRHLLAFPFGTKISPEGIYRFPVQGFQQYLILYRCNDRGSPCLSSRSGLDPRPSGSLNFFNLVRASRFRPSS